ncbi:predicted protein [Streptomyces viridochromogenes DSM 40736]|uniref:Predicted protein n=1 Tax=Streptomyces viridochromogenes (strain DSM 40736 / JCM 4977 / BCRC 1201 / Tue 494) TaxID=591159 RepID=D9X1R2_STRVT|nr:hypothetical protein [Streptomyces viridochromogenes]EFL29484.1 predicted protein [Streptomyces viridochromogenes DSM 40736]EFL37181.1 predicted protein [Streptomyces viridochromogenes DSM 40736]
MADPHPAVYEAYFTRTPFQLLAGVGWKRLVAFCVDSTGILLGGAPARYKAQTAFVPWEDITSVVVWQQRMAGPSMDYVGVHRRAGAPELPGANRKMTPAQAARTVPHVEYELLRASRPINFWRLDPHRLQAAVDSFAPHVPVLVYQQPHLR